MAHVVDRRHARPPVDRYSREESTLGEIIAVAESTFTACLSAAGRLFKRLLRPAAAATVSSWYCWRGSIERGEEHLRRVLAEYVGYFVESRPHQGLGQRTPAQVAQDEALSNAILGAPAAVESIPDLGGLHHEYRRAA